MDYRDWEIIKLLYQYKNVTKTSQVLFMSQPAITSRLKHIEEEFDVPLFIRSRRGVHFTPQGQYLAACAEEALSHYVQVKENIKSMNNDFTGTLRLGVSNFYAKYKLPVILKLFRELYPQVEFNVSTGWSSQIFKAIYNHDVHIGLIRGDFPWKEQHHLLHEERICIASREEINLKDLPNLPRIEYKTDHILRTQIDNWWTANYTQGSTVSIEVDQVDTCKEMLVNDLGYAILPSQIIDGVDGINKVDLIDSEGKPLVRRTWMYYHQNSLELNMVKAFVEFMKAFNSKEN